MQSISLLVFKGFIKAGCDGDLWQLVSICDAPPSDKRIVLYCKSIYIIQRSGLTSPTKR
jgi:hypothetical protein